MKVGFIVNPIAGMGGRVGLKGTDGVADLALKLGGKPVSLKRAAEALNSIEDSSIFFLTCSGKMGEDVLKGTGFSYEVIFEAPDTTTAADTKEAARRMLESGCDLILFSGGDGTAWDIVSVVNEEIPVLGIPAGVKIFSGVFGITPAETGRIVSSFIETSVRDVLDIDEEAYRQNQLNISIKGEALVPVSMGVQGGKETSAAADSKLDIAHRILDDHMAAKDDMLYIIGPGTTTMEVKRQFGTEGTLLGVDVVKAGKIIIKDACEKDLLEGLQDFSGRVVIIVSPIGSQGFIFGRGNQQISPGIIRRADEIKVIASPDKLASTPCLHVDTGDGELDERLRGYMKVQTGYHDLTMMKVV